jgi:hypothetical protein
MLTVQRKNMLNARLTAGAACAALTQSAAKQKKEPQKQLSGVKQGGVKQSNGVTSYESGKSEQTQ